MCTIGKLCKDIKQFCSARDPDQSGRYRGVADYGMDYCQNGGSGVNNQHNDVANTMTSMMMTNLQQQQIPPAGFMDQSGGTSAASMFSAIIPQQQPPQQPFIGGFVDATAAAPPQQMHASLLPQPSLASSSGVQSPMMSNAASFPQSPISPASVGSSPMVDNVGQMDQTFVQYHNYSVEVYQAFKEDINVLFSGNIAIQDQNHIITRILQTVENLIVALESEKEYLMSSVLCSWALHQQKLSIASTYTQQLNYNHLTTIDTQFEYFGELLEQTLGGLQYLCEQYAKIGFEEVLARVRHITHLFLFYSIIVSKQPPAVVVKCGEAENHRRSRFWFNTEIRMLGGRAFGLHRDSLQIKCFLITDETARKLRGNPYYEVSDNEQFVIEPNNSQFQTLAADGSEFGAVFGTPTLGAFVAKFDDMRVSKKEQLRREEVWKKRYHLCYNVRVATTTSKCPIELIGKKVSLPFAILVGPKCDVEAKLFLERSFSDFIRQPDADLPPSVDCMEMVDALEMKFQAILETPQKSTDQIAPSEPREFCPHSKRHLMNRLKPDQSGQILLDNFLKMPVAEEYCVKRSTLSATLSSASAFGGGASPNNAAASGAAASDPGEWKLVPFFEWFFKLAELVNKNFVQLWNDGLIFGFCGKDEAEMLLAGCHRPTLLIRFSDFEFGKIKISVRDQMGVIRHHWYDTQDLVARSLSEELLHNAKYRDVEYIYPDVDLAAAVGARLDVSHAVALERMRKPRNLQPSPIYFNNQEPAVMRNTRA